MRGRAALASTVARSVLSIAASSPACGVSTVGRWNPPSTWVSASASTTSGTRSSSAATSSSPTSCPPPEPTTHAWTRPAPTTSGWAAADPVGDLARSDVPDHAAESARGAGDAEQPGAGVLRAAGPDADDAAGVLLRVRLGARQQGRDVTGLEGLDGCVGQVEADVDQVDRPAGRGRRVDQVGDLVGAEGDRDLGASRGARRARRCRRRPRSGRRPRPPARRRPPAAPPAPRGADPAGRRSRRSRRRPPRVGSGAGARRCTPSGASQRGDASLVSVVGQQQRLDLHPPAGQQRPGVQRVAAVVAGPDQQQHPSPVRRAEQVDHGVRQARGGPLHQRTLGESHHQLGLGGPHLLDRVRASHAAHASRVVSPRGRPGARSGSRPVPVERRSPPQRIREGSRHARSTLASARRRPGRAPQPAAAGPPGHRPGPDPQQRRGRPMGRALVHGREYDDRRDQPRPAPVVGSAARRATIGARRPDRSRGLRTEALAPRPRHRAGPAEARSRR